MLVVNPWHWLRRDGSLPDEPRRLRHQALRVARLIEYGAPLDVGEGSETLVECSKRTGKKPCLGFLVVTKTDADDIYAACPTCEREEILIHEWQDTPWGRPPDDEDRSGVN